MPYCINHPEKYAIDKCPKCGQIFCPHCLVDIHGVNYCQGCMVQLRASGIEIRDYPKINILKEIKRVNKGFLFLVLISITFIALSIRLKIRNNTLTDTLYQKSAQIVSLDRRIKAQEDKIQFQEEKLNKLIPEREALQKELEKMALALNSSHMDLEQTKSLVGILRSKLNAQNEVINSLKKMVENLTAEKEILEERLSSSKSPKDIKPTEGDAKARPVMPGNQGFLTRKPEGPESEKKIVIEVLPSGQ